MTGVGASAPLSSPVEALIDRVVVVADLTSDLCTRTQLHELIEELRSPGNEIVRMQRTLDEITDDAREQAQRDDAAAWAKRPAVPLRPRWQPRVVQGGAP